MSSQVLNFKKTADLVFEKKGISSDIIARVGFCLDTSGSMYDTYSDGLMNTLNAMMLPVALRLDDNGTLEVCAFSSEAYELPDMNIDNCENYVSKFIVPNFNSLTGGTFFSRGIKEFIKRWEPGKAPESRGFFKRLKDSITGEEPDYDHLTEGSLANSGEAPGLIILQTDGRNMDQGATIDVLRQLKAYNIFVTFVGTGDDVNLEYLQSLASVSDNSYAFRIDDLRRINEDFVYEQLTNEKFVNWIKKVR